MSRCPCGHSWSGRDCKPPGGTDTDDGEFVPQEGAQTAQGRIAAVAAAHRNLCHLTVLPNVARCSCGWTERTGFIPDRSPTHDAHLAAAVVEALGLTPERRTNVMSSAGMTIDTKTGVTTHHSDIRYDQRWVTRWEQA